MSSWPARMRLLAGLLAASGPARAQAVLGVGGPGFFDLRALQSCLMVTALRCDRPDDHDRFVLRVRADLANAYRTIGTVFRRLHGRDAQRLLDTCITALANRHPQDGMALGGKVCQRTAPLWNEVMEQPNTINLAALASRRSLANQVEEVLAAAPARHRTAGGPHGDPHHAALSAGAAS